MSKLTYKSINNIQNFYHKRKELFEVIGFIGVITALFLQIPYEGLKSLKYLQALLLLIFSIALILILIIFWYEVFINRNETSKSIVISVIYSSIAIVFVINLMRFMVEVFGKQLRIYLEYVQFPVILLGMLFLDDFVKKLPVKMVWKVVLIAVYEIGFYMLLFVRIVLNILTKDGVFIVRKIIIIVSIITLFLSSFLFRIGFLKKKTGFILTSLSVFVLIVLVLAI